MLKKFLAGIFLLMIISAQASAIRLEFDPEPIGKISFDGDKFEIEGATKIDGDNLKGVALFGEDFYFHFDADRIYNRFGDRDKKNTAEVDIYGETEIFQIGNTAGADFYLLRKDSGTGDLIKVLGLRDGKWIEFFDVRTLREKYDIGWNFYMTKFFTEDNKIIFRYQLQNNFIDVVCRWHAVNQKFYTEAIEH